MLTYFCLTNLPMDIGLCNRLVMIFVVQIGYSKIASYSKKNYLLCICREKDNESTDENMVHILKPMAPPHVKLHVGLFHQSANHPLNNLCTVLIIFLLDNLFSHLADQGKARGCSTNTFVILSLIH